MVSYFKLMHETVLFFLVRENENIKFDAKIKPFRQEL